MANKTTSKKPAAKKPASKTASKKPAAKKTTAKKPTAKKAAAKKPAAKKTAVKKTTVKKAAAKKPAAKKPASKAAPKKAAPKKPAAAKKPAAKAPAKVISVKKDAKWVSADDYCENPNVKAAVAKPSNTIKKSEANLSNDDLADLYLQESRYEDLCELCKKMLGQEETKDSPVWQERLNTAQSRLAN